MANVTAPEVAARLLRARTVWIGTHVDPDGDAIGSLLGLGRSLRSIGHGVRMACQDPVPREARHLPGIDEIGPHEPAPETDLLVALDAGDADRLGNLFDPSIWEATDSLVIDHHLSNPGFGRLNWIDPSSASTCEMVERLIEPLGVVPDAGTAACLLTGIVTDTLGFRTSNTRPETLDAARRLMERGADLAQIAQHTFGRRPLGALRLIGRAMSRLDTDGGIGIAHITLDDLAELQVSPAEARGIAGFIATAEELRAAAVLRERDDGQVDVSMRASPGVSLLAAAAELGGGGHPAAAGARVAGPIDRALEEVRRALHDHLDAAGGAVDAPEPIEPAPEPAEPAVPAWAERAFRDASSIIPLIPRPAGAARAPSSVRAAASELPKSGILAVDKPSGMTSHDVVQALRRATGERRIGHAGTLDPMATGVLVVCMGSATRVVESIQERPKRYVARIELGAETDTYDAEGQVTAKADPGHVRAAEVEAALDSFRGDIAQVPPMYSALRHSGKRLYELARSGLEIEREARPVTVYAIAMTAWEPPELVLEMEVSKGTYVRSLAHDLGRLLGVGAHLTALRRTAVGDFTLDEAESLDRAVEAFEEGWWPHIVYPVDAALRRWPALVVSEDDEARLRMGQQIEAPGAVVQGLASRGADPATGSGAPGHGHAWAEGSGKSPVTGLARAYSEEGAFIGIVRWDDVHERWQPDKIFPRGGQAQASSSES